MKGDTSALFGNLRLLAQKKGFLVYNIYIRRAGIGIAYVSIRDAKRAPFPEFISVYRYWPTLRKAVVGEIKAWQGDRGTT